MAYLLDANVFIEAKRRHYGMDFCQAFWDWLLATNASGRVFSIEKVSDELRAGADELADWASARQDDFFLRPDEAMLETLAVVGTWVREQHYRPSAVSAFLEMPITIASLMPEPSGTPSSPMKCRVTVSGG